MSNFKSSKNNASTSKSYGLNGGLKRRADSLEFLVRTAMTNGELSPGVAAQIDRYRQGTLSCEDRRMLAILENAIADGCVIPIEMPLLQNRRQIAYSQA
ncbi:MAG: hypothetical protein WBA76_21655 [Phormidesmis sp.]